MLTPVKKIDVKTNTSISDASHSEDTAEPQPLPADDNNPADAADDADLVTVINGVHFHLCDFMFLVDQEPIPLHGCPYTAYFWRTISQLLDYDDDIREGDTIIDEPIPAGYLELRTNLLALVDPWTIGALSELHVKDTVCDRKKPAMSSHTTHDTDGPSSPFKTGGRRSVATQPKNKKRKVSLPPGLEHASYTPADLEVINYTMIRSVRTKMRQEQHWKENKLRRRK
ncbi:hypothetical protein PUNSTDRAFT_131510 [Punctularia strigosozonata HHB-11173 SS5]|uniref:uncharacterized protein n=1 Tax=Punctularia strigosozonata (strain HHB-11173) TaxID=741275 RepID=UPI00044186DD|nr:uncharacterized protein PUNSTDRAFT_131510 [Punctularia strigosozonata HHB-11173 SS5]EIN11347.1 hypothetical protein PUNSTDRAFT_131510 [Punctularia strigosozonata HHB-11173 SS5]